MKMLHSFLSRVKSGALHPEELPRLYWKISTFAYLALLIILCFHALSAPEEHIVTMVCTGFVVIIHGGTVLFVSGELPTLKSITSILKRLLLYAYYLLCKLLEWLLGKTTAAPPAEWVYPILNEFLSYVFNSQARQLTFFQTLFYEETPIMGTKQKFLVPHIEPMFFLYNDIIPIYCISIFRIGCEMLSDDLLNQGHTVVKQMLVHNLENGQLSLGNYPPCYVKGFPTLYLLKTYDTGSHVRFCFAWVNSKKIADAVRAYEAPAIDDGNSDDEDF